MQTITIAEFIEQLKDEGVILYVNEGKVRTRGPAEVVARWKASMVVRKDELYEYLVAQEARYLDPIKQYDEEQYEDVKEKKLDAWNEENSWAYYMHLLDMLMARKRQSTKDIPLVSNEVAHLGRLINLAAMERDPNKFRQATDRWYDAYMEMLDQAEQGIWPERTVWNKHAEAIRIYGRTTHLILYAYSLMPEESRPRRDHPEIMKIEREITRCFHERDLESLQDACFALTKKWRELGLVVNFR